MHIQDDNKLPVVPLRGGVVFPGMTTTISIGRSRSLAAAQAAVKGGGEILILVQYDSEIEEPTTDELLPVGILATVRDVMRAPHVGVQMLVELHRRVRFGTLLESDPYMVGTYEEIEDQSDGRPEDLMAEVIAALEEYAEMLGEVNRQVMMTMRSQKTAGDLADYIAGLLNIPFEMEVELLSNTHGVDRLEKVREYLQQ